jgi:hypothetical protein
MFWCGTGDISEEYKVIKKKNEGVCHVTIYRKKGIVHVPTTNSM